MTGDSSHGERHQRTMAYTGGVRPDVPAGVTSGPATAATPAGQVAILTAVNMLVRAHPEVFVAVSDETMVVSSPCGGSSLQAACRNVAAAANSECRLVIVEELPPAMLSMGIGDDSNAAWIYADARGWTAITCETPVDRTLDAPSLLALGMAVTLAAGIIFRAAVDRPYNANRGVSLWSLEETSRATGPSTCGPVDVGTVWLVGAGAVGSCLAWWLHFVGVVGQWTIVDGDVAKTSNLNRSLGLFEIDLGSDDRKPTSKATAAAELISAANAFPGWWDDWMERNPTSPDLLIPVANDFGVRAKVAAYGHPAVMHATTSPNWTAELHRQLVGIDCCLACRFPEDAPRFECATDTIEPDGLADDVLGEVGEDDESRKDAALPFLSAGAAALLAAGLLQLQSGQWRCHSANHWRFFYDDSARDFQAVSWKCDSGCAVTAPLTIRRRMHDGTRWFSLDGFADEGVADGSVNVTQL